MWKGGSSTAPNGELYFYTASGSGFGADLCNGNWHFAADGKWHSIEQLVNINTGSITIWSDGTNVCQVTEPLPGAHSGVFFSTFHGGHDTSFSPSKTVTDEFADFTLSTDGPQTTGATGPATPVNLAATATSSSSIGLSWIENNNSDPAVSFKVYEGTTVVGNSATTGAVIAGLTAGSTHTFTVTAVDAAGTESSHSISATATTPNPTTTPAAPSGLVVTGTTNSSISLSWTESNNADPAASYNVYEGGTVVATSATTTATVGGLTPGSTHTYTVTAVDAAAAESTSHSNSATATTPNPTTTPAVPSHLTVASSTTASISLTWLEINNGDPAASSKVYEGASVVATTTTTAATIGGLSAGSTHTYTVTSLDSAGHESAHSASVTGSTSGGGGGGLTVSIAKTKDWGSGYTDTATVTNTSGSTITGWNVQFDLDPSENIESSAGVTYASSAHHYTLSNVPSDASIAAGAHLQFQFSGDYGSHYIAPTNVAAYALNATQSPATPTNLTVTGATSSSISLSWTENNNSDPAASYKVIEGGVTLATTTSTTATINNLGPSSTHTYTVTAVDAAGNGSAMSAPVTGTTTAAAPAPPTNLTVSATTSSSISVSWVEQNNTDPATSFKVYEGSTVVASVTVTNATIAGLAPNSTHTYTVTAVDPAGLESTPSNSVTTTTGPASSAPATPTGLAVTGTTNSTITLSWTETNNSDPAVSYNIYEGSSIVASSSTTTCTVSGLSANSTHTYSTTAVDAAGHESTAHSNPVIGTTNATPTPAAPTGLTVTATTSSSITLAWTETNNSDPAISYNVYEATTVVGTSTNAGATIGGLTAGSSHTYTVTAVDSAGVESTSHSIPVTGTTSGGAGFTQSLIDSAVAAPLFAWAAPTSSVPRPGTNPLNIGEAKVLYYLALVDRQAPGSHSTGGTSVDSALLAQVRSMVAGGKEPDADGALEMWGQAPVAHALLLLKNGPAWSELTSAEQNKVDLLEAAMGYGSNYTYNDANNFSSGICGFGNFSKTNNPNYRDGGVDTEIAAIEYFGASTWDTMLTNFNDATITAQLNAAGLTNAGGCFATAGSAANSAIARPFVYQGHPSNDLMGIWSTIAGNTFDKTAQSTVSPAHIADGSTSPYDGQCCMGHEFNSTDSSGLRSSALYTFEGWMNLTGSRVTMEVLGNFNLNAATTETQYHIGTLDLKYKLDHGYISQALNQSMLLVDDHGNPASDGPNVKGFLYDWDAYMVCGAAQS
jgi:hypothetical protein